MSTRTKLYLFITFAAVGLIFISYQNHKPKNQAERHSEVQSVKENWESSKPKKQCEFNPEKFLESLVYIQGNYGGVGAGFIIELDGKKYVLTANHVSSFHDQNKYDLNFYHREPNKH